MNREQRVFFDEVKKDEAFQAILKKVEENHGSKVKRLVRTAQQGKQFYFTLILENYELLEVTLTAGRLGHMAALECEVEVY
jgi:hypothetical protein